MPAIINMEIDVLKNIQHILIRTYDKGNISKEDYIKQNNEIQNKIDMLNKILIEKDVKHQVKDVQMVEIEKLKQLHNVKKEEIKMETQKEGINMKGDKKMSTDSCIVRILSLGKVKNVDELIVEVKKELPNIEDKKIKAQFSGIKSCIKSGWGKKYQQLVWDEDTFTIKQK